MCRPVQIGWPIIRKPLKRGLRRFGVAALALSADQLGKEIALTEHPHRNRPMRHLLMRREILTKADHVICGFAHTATLALYGLIIQALLG